jgi:hypothetical protein
LRFLPFHFIEIHPLHELIHTANRFKKQVHVIPNLMDVIPAQRDEIPLPRQPQLTCAAFSTGLDRNGKGYSPGESNTRLS